MYISIHKPNNESLIKKVKSKKSIFEQYFFDPISKFLFGNQRNICRR